MEKILIIAPSLSIAGGAEKTAALLANYLVEAQFHVSICVMSIKEPGYALNKSIEYIKVDSYCKMSNTIIKNIERYKWIKKYVAEVKYNLLIGYTIQGGIMASAISMATGIKCIVCERQDPHQFSPLMRLVRDILYNYASGAVFQTAAAQDYFKKIIRDSIIIPNFIDSQNLPAVVPWKDRKNIIVSVGRLVQAKNHKLLIDAFCNLSSEFRNYNVQIWGDGPLYNDLLNYIKSKQLSKRITLCGRSEKVLEEIRYAKLFVLSSDYEGYPNALLEAMCLGIPSISTDCPCGGPRDMLDDGVNGVLVPVGSVEELTKSIRQLLSGESYIERIARVSIGKRVTNDKQLLFSKWLSYIRRIIESQ